MQSGLLRNNRSLGVLAALGLGFTAQYLYTGEWLTRWNDSNTWSWEPRYTLASFLLIAAIACATWALAGGTEAFANAATAGSEAAPQTGLNFWPLLAAGCYLLSLVSYWNSGENSTVQLLWLMSILCLVIPLWRKEAAQPDVVPAHWSEWALVAAVTGLGFVLRYWHLTEIPSHVDNDVALMGTWASQLIDTGNYAWVGLSGSGHLLSYDQFLAWSMRLFGENHYGLVMSSVITGTLTLPLVYWLGRDLFNWRVGLVAMALLTINYTHIQFSRILFGPTSTFTATLTFYLMFRGLKTRQTRWFALSGLAAGFGLLVYDSSRIVPVIILAVVTWRLLWEKTAFLSNIRNWSLFALGALIGFGPMLGFALKDFDLFVGRGNDVTLWTPTVWQHQAESYQLNSFGAVVLEQAKRTFLTFYLYGDGSPHFAFPRPMVAPLTAVLLALGVGYSLWRLRDVRFFSLLMWIVLTFILGGVLTYDPPYWPHLNIALPAIMVLAAVGADKILETLAPEPQEFGYLSLRVVGLGLITFTGLSNWQAYLNFVDDNADRVIRVARYVSELPPDYEVYFVSDSINWDEYAFRFFDRGVEGIDTTAEQLLASPPPLDHPLLFILVDHRDQIEALHQHYPTGIVEEHYNDMGNVVFESLEVSPPDYVFQPLTNRVNPFILPGWWLMALGLLLGTMTVLKSLRRRHVAMAAA